MVLGVQKFRRKKASIVGGEVLLSRERRQAPFEVKVKEDDLLSYTVMKSSVSADREAFTGIHRAAHYSGLRTVMAKKRRRP